MKKATLAAIILAAVACFTAPAGQLLPEEKPISFNVPSYGPLAEEAFNLGAPPSYGRDSEENFSFAINKFTQITIVRRTTRKIALIIRCLCLCTTKGTQTQHQYI